MEGTNEWTKNTYLKRENHQVLEKSPLGFSGKKITLWLNLNETSLKTWVTISRPSL